MLNFKAIKVCYIITFTYKAILWVPIDLYLSRFITHSTFYFTWITFLPTNTFKCRLIFMTFRPGILAFTPRFPNILAPMYILITYFLLFCLFFVSLTPFTNKPNFHDIQRRTLRSETVFDYWKPFKMMENTSYSTSTNFLSWLFGHAQNGLIKKTKLISNYIPQYLKT